MRSSFPRIALFVALLSAPITAQSPSVSPPAVSTSAAFTVPYTQFTLPNGLHVILHEDHTVPVVSVAAILERFLSLSKQSDAHSSG